MRTFVRLTLLSVWLPLLACAALAQPARRTPAPDTRCESARYKYEGVVSDKAHRTVEEQSRVEYDEAKKYLRVCWESPDDFTRSLKKFVSRHEDIARCDEAWTRLSPRLKSGGPGTPERFHQTYEASKEFLRICDGADTEEARYVKTWVEKYDALVRQFEAEKALATLYEEARAGSTNPTVYSRMAEAFVAARYEPQKRQLLSMIEAGKPLDSKDVREVWAEMVKALDSVVDAYARAIATCAAGDGCEVALGTWRGGLVKFYMLRHDGSQEGLEQTIAHALDAPPSKP